MHVHLLVVAVTSKTWREGSNINDGISVQLKIPSMVDVKTIKHKNLELFNCNVWLSFALLAGK